MKKLQKYTKTHRNTQMINPILIFNQITIYKVQQSYILSHNFGTIFTHWKNCFQQW